MRWLSDQVPEIADIWSPSRAVLLERRLWLQVMRGQRQLAPHLKMTAVDLDVYQQVLFSVDLDSIRARELRTKHDLKARLEEFNDLASKQACRELQLAHLGMTSADVVENVSLMQIRQSLRVLADMRPSVGSRLDQLAARLPFRGIKGAVGTMQDQADLLGSLDRARELDRRVAAAFHFSNLMNSVPQTYYRSLDLEVASTVYNFVLGLPAHWARPVVAGYQAMVADYAGSTWNEGDVSTSSVRRVALPGLFVAAAAVVKQVDPPPFLAEVW